MMNGYLLAMLFLGIAGMITAGMITAEVESMRTKKILYAVCAMWAIVWIVPPLVTIWINGVLGI